MKRILLFTLIAFMCNGLLSQNADYSDKWKKIDSLMTMGLNKSALDEAVKIYDKAIADKDYATAGRAIIYRSANQITLYDEQTAIESLLQDVEQLPQPAKSTVYAITGSVYKNYYTTHGRQIRSRTRVADTVNDIKTWDMTRLFEEALKYYKLSIVDEEILKRTPFDNYRAIADYTKDSTLKEMVFPTLYDFLVFNAISAFGQEASVVLPQQTFVLDKPEYFADVNTFVNYTIETPDSLSAEYNVVGMYQKLLKFRLQENDNAAALVGVDIERLRYVYRKGCYDNNSAMYENALESLMYKYVETDEWAYAAYALAVLYNEREKFKQACDLCTKIISLYSKNDELQSVVKSATTLIEKIKQPLINISFKTLQYPNSPMMALVKYGNINKIYLRIYSVDKDYYTNYVSGRRDYRSRGKIMDAITGVKDKKPATIKKIALPLKDDYREHSAEIMIDGLPQGYYLIITGMDAGFSDDIHRIAHTAFQVSPLEIVLHKGAAYEMYVAEAKTGMPLKDATVECYYKNNNNNNVYVRTSKTNENGIASMPNENKWYDEALIKHGDKRLLVNDYYYYNRNENKRDRRQVTFFTDRAIYRPGQTVYYKALCLDIDAEERYGLAKNASINIKFTDVNNQVIATQQQTTNEYGSVGGSFTVPQGLLNGNMRLSSEYYGDTYIRVEEYKRPTFEVKFDTVRKNYRLNDSVRLTGKVNSFAGYHVDNAKVKYRIIRDALYWRFYRWVPYSGSRVREIASGTVDVDNKGEFVINFKAEADDILNDNLIYDYMVTVDITDVNGETRSDLQFVKIGKKSLLVNADIPERIINRENLKFGITTTNPNNNFTPADLRVTVTSLKSPEGILRARLWEVPDTAIMSRAEFKRYFPLDLYMDEDRPQTFEKGKQLASYASRTAGMNHKVDFQAFAEAPAGWYRIDIIATNDDGIEAEVVNFVRLDGNPVSKSSETVAPAITNMSDWLTEVKTSGEPGEYAEFWAGGSEDKSYIYYEIARKSDIVERKIVIADGAPKHILIPIKEEHRGGFDVQFLMIQNGRTYMQSRHITVPFTDKQLDITFTTFRDKLLPGENEKWTLKVKNAKGEKETAEMVATLYDASLNVFKTHSWYSGFYPQYYTNSYWDVSRQYADHFANTNEYYYINPRIFNYRYMYTDYIYPLFGNSIMLRSTSVNLNDVTVVAFGSQKKESVVDALAGRIPGVQEFKFAESAAVNEEVSEESPQFFIRGTTDYQPNSKLTEVATRQNFNETAFFYPQLRTNEEGEIAMEFTIPEALTRWKMLGFAHTQDFKVGNIENELITQKQVAVSANAPRFFRENDTIEFTAKVNNITENDLNGQAMLRLYDAATMQPVDAKIVRSPQTQSFDLKAGLSAGLKWTLIIPESVQAISYKLTAQAGNHTDGEEKIIPVLKNSMLVTETMPFGVRAGQQKSFTFKNFKNKRTSTLRDHRLTLEYSSNPAWYAIQAMPYMMEYPYECAEQTFTRFYSNSLATTVVNSSPRVKQIFDMWRNLPEYGNALLSNLEKNRELKQALLEETPWVMQAQNETERKKRVALLFDLNRMSVEQKAAFEKVKKAQANDGGFPWFSGTPSSFFITSHIISGFEHLKKLDALGSFDDDAKRIVSSGLNFMDGEVRTSYKNLLRYKADMNRQNIGYEELRYLYTCSFSKHKPQYPEAFDYYFAQAKKYRTQFNLYAQAMIALTMHRFGDEATAKLIIRSLKEQSQRSDEMGMYWKNNTAGYFWYQAPIETQAMMIEAFDEITDDKQAVEEMKIWLLRNKQTNDWRTTKATAEACYALLMTGANLLDESQSLDVKLGNSPLSEIASEEIRPEPGTGYVKTAWSGTDINKDMATLTVANPNKSGMAYGGMYWQYFEQLDKITGAETGLKLYKRLFMKTNTERGAELLPLTEDNVLAVGDLVTVRVELHADRDYEYIHLKDMRAAGLEPTNAISGYRYQDGLWYYENIRDASVNFFITYLNKGVYVFEYNLRVTHEGAMSNGITTVQCMYAPEFASHSEGIRIKVKR